MNITIPDKLSKLLFLIGIILIGYSLYYRDNKGIEFLKQKVSISKEKNPITIFLSRVENNLEADIKELDKIKLLLNDSSKISKTEIKLQLNAINELSKDDLKKITKLDDKLKVILENENLFNEAYQHDFEFANKLLYAGLAIFSLGMLLWFREDPTLGRQIENVNEKLYRCCQSCGERFNSIIKYGTENNSTLNYAFCKECYEHGNFTNPILTKEELILSTFNSLNRKNWFTKQIVKSKIASLERWRTFSNSSLVRFMYLWNER